MTSKPQEVIASAYKAAPVEILEDAPALGIFVASMLEAAGYSIIATAELERLQEMEAEQSGRFRVQEIIKPERDKDLYVGWSHVCEMPAWAGTREQALAEGCPPSRLRRADKRGTSMKDDFGCAWDHGGLIAEQRGYLPRARIGDYATLYLLGRTQEAFGLLEPFDGETEVRRD